MCFHFWSDLQPLCVYCWNVELKQDRKSAGRGRYRRAAAHSFQRGRDNLTTNDANVTCSTSWWKSEWRWVKQSLRDAAAAEASAATRESPSVSSGSGSEICVRVETTEHVRGTRHLNNKEAKRSKGRAGRRTEEKAKPLWQGMLIVITPSFNHWETLKAVSEGALTPNKNPLSAPPHKWS